MIRAGKTDVKTRIKAEGFRPNGWSPKNSISFHPSIHERISRMAFDRGISFASVVRELVDKGLQ